jgi:hypothetical protein
MVGVHPPPSPDWANFTLKIECTPESSRCMNIGDGDYLESCFLNGFCKAYGKYHRMETLLKC